MTRLAPAGPIEARKARKARARTCHDCGRAIVPGEWLAGTLARPVHAMCAEVTGELAERYPPPPTADEGRRLWVLLERQELAPPAGGLAIDPEHVPHCVSVPGGLSGVVDVRQWLTVPVPRPSWADEGGADGAPRWLGWLEALCLVARIGTVGGDERATDALRHVAYAELRAAAWGVFASAHVGVVLECLDLAARGGEVTASLEAVRRRQRGPARRSANVLVCAIGSLAAAEAGGASGDVRDRAIAAVAAARTANCRGPSGLSWAPEVSWRRHLVAYLESESAGCRDA